MSLPSVSPRAYRRITLAALWALGFIVVTGAAVRLTNSGLGCTDWPRCTHTALVPSAGIHPWIEFGNRLVTGAVSVVVGLAVLGSLKREGQRRRDLVWLSIGLVAGVCGQIVLGGLTVLFKLSPPFVMGHFLVSMLLVWCAVVLHHRAGLDDAGAARGPGSGTPPTTALVGAAAVVLFLGTVVTSSGPHGGDPKASRLPFTVHDATRAHSGAVWVFLLLTVAGAAWLVRTGAPAAVVQRAEVLLAVLVGQMAVGYTQYFTRLPAALVGVHVAGATAVWVAVLRLDLAARAVRGAGAVDPTRAVEPARWAQSRHAVSTH
jgi:cytochrome c oxidase assembly protein subunit 15